MRFMSAVAALAVLASMAGVAAAQTIDRPPTISGSPPTTIKVNTTYNFMPSALDPEGKPLQFSIVNRPSWMAFSPNSGRMMGYPKSPGTWHDIQVRVTDGVHVMSLPAFTLTVTTESGSTPANRAPTISGTPAITATVGTAYSFQPSASDADGNSLGFSIKNRPGWADFSTATGRLSGTPRIAGTAGNIVISVSDGRATAALPAFSITVVDVSSSNVATLSWSAPTANTDGSALTNLAGYRIAYGTATNALTQSIQVANPSVTDYTINNLSPGTYYFAVRAYTSSGTQSASSNIASKVVR